MLPQLQRCLPLSHLHHIAYLCAMPSGQQQQQQQSLTQSFILQ